MIGCGDRHSNAMIWLANPEVSYTSSDLVFRQELVNDAPIGPGEPQASNHCPNEPGTWFAGCGRSTATSNVFGKLTGVEVYCPSGTFRVLPPLPEVPLREALRCATSCSISSAPRACWRTNSHNAYLSGVTQASRCITRSTQKPTMPRAGNGSAAT